MLRRPPSKGCVVSPLLLALGLALAPLGCSDTGGGKAPANPIIGPMPDRFVLEFDGINDYASTGTAFFPGTDDPQSYSLWVRYIAGDDPQSFLVLRKFLDYGVHLGVRGGRLAAWRTSDNAVLVEGPPLSVQTWHHVAYAYDGKSTHTLFLNGAQVATSSTTAFDTRYNISCYLGTFEGTQQMFTGQMDNVRIWGLVRSAAEVAAEMRNQVPPQPEGLLAWWGFDEDSGALGYDYSGHGNTCTLGDGDPTRMPVRVPSTILYDAPNDAGPSAGDGGGGAAGDGGQDRPGEAGQDRPSDGTRF